MNEEMAKKYTAQLQHVSNDTMRNLTAEQLEKLDGIIDDLITDLQSHEDEYLAQTSQESYAFALQYANVMRQRTSLLGNDKQYSMLRDEYLAENAKWIVEFEAQRGHNKLFISAHNGHIEKHRPPLVINPWETIWTKCMEIIILPLGLTLSTAHFRQITTELIKEKTILLKIGIPW